MAGDTSSDWIKGAIHHHGALRRKAAAAGETTREFAEKHKGDKGKTGDQARLAITLMGMHHKPAAKKSAGEKMYDKAK